jgi:hypothetical protein
MLQEKFRNTYEFNARVINDMNCIELVIPFCKGGYYAKSADSR